MLFEQVDTDFLGPLLRLEKIFMGFICLSKWVGGQIVQNMFEQVDFVKAFSHLLFELLTIRTQIFVRSLSQFLSTKLSYLAPTKVATHDHS